MNIPTNHPDVVGAYSVDGRSHFHAATFHELDRTGGSFAEILATYGFASESFVLVVSMTPEVTYFAPFETALQHLGIYGTNADDSPFDAGRVESLSRQVKYVAACGIGQNVLNGLQQFGHDPAKVFAGRTVWARPDAYAEVAALDGVDARKIGFFGPAIGIECAHGSVHVDDREWSFGEIGGNVKLSSRLHHVEPIADLDTGVKGRLASKPCSCSSALAVIDLE